MRVLRKPVFVVAASFLLLVPAVVSQDAAQDTAQDSPAPVIGGWICGRVLLENRSPALAAEVSLRLDGDSEGAAVASATVDRNGDFCMEGIRKGFYDLTVSVPRWPLQPPRHVEARQGLVNRLTPPFEVEFEPGDPSIRAEESFDGMSSTRANSILRALMERGDTVALEEAVRRFLPKSGVTIDLDRVAAGFDPMPLAQQIMRTFEQGALPPIKTARYLFLLGEFGDPRTEEVVIPFLIQRLSDGRPLPIEMTLTESPVYVSDIVIQEIMRYSGRDFRWKYGVPAVRNSSAISRARSWWLRERDKRNEQ